MYLQKWLYLSGRLSVGKYTTASNSSTIVRCNATFFTDFTYLLDIYYHENSI